MVDYLKRESVSVRNCRSRRRVGSSPAATSVSSLPARSLSNLIQNNETSSSVPLSVMGHVVYNTHLCAPLARLTMKVSVDGFSQLRSRSLTSSRVCFQCLIFPSIPMGNE